MRVAQITSWGMAPVTKSVPAPPPPTTTQLQLKIAAVGIHRLVRGRALGLHPTARNASLPFDPSVDGVGLDEKTGHFYYINALSAPLFAERANVNRSQLFKLGRDTQVDPTAVAALVNPVSSSWMALRARVQGLNPGCNLAILILGATSASGRAAIEVARSLGATRVLGVSRRKAELETLDGLDEHLLLNKDTSITLPQDLGPIHVVLDYIGGHAAASILSVVQVEPGKGLQYVHIGDLGGQDKIVLPGHLLNKKNIRVMGSGMGSWSGEDLQKEMPRLLDMVERMERPHDLLIASLDNIQSAWTVENSGRKTVLVP